MIRLTRHRSVGRYEEIETGRKVNLRCGDRVGRGTTTYFYLHRQRRVYLDEYTISRKWKYIGPVV